MLLRGSSFRPAIAATIMRIHHLALRTRDVARLRAFYVDVVGLAPVDGDAPERAWLDADGAIVMIERAVEGEPGIAAGTRELVAFAIAPGQLAAFESRLARRGVSVEARTRFTLYFRDPDGRRVGVSHYPESLEAAGWSTGVERDKVSP